MRDFAKKRVAVLGAGVENVPLVRWLIKKGASVVVADQKRKEELPTYSQLKDLPVEWRFGPRYLDDLADFAILFRTPMLPASNTKLLAAKEKGIEISSQTKLFFELSPAPIIGVTGTNGKGTTSSLIYEMLKAAGFDVHLGGNIGNPPITFLEKLQPSSWVVLELSSYQLEDLETSPHIAVVLNITPDHLDRHKTFLEYLEAKKQIVKHQKSSDYAVLIADYMTTMECAVETPAEIHLISTKKAVERGAYAKGEALFLAENGPDELVVKLSDTRLVGRHNLENIGAAAIVATLAGATISSLRVGAKQFKGLPHRLQHVGSVRGIDFYDDSYSTTPAPAMAAVRSFVKPVILLAGGSSKKSDFSELGRVIARDSSVRDVILLGSVEGPKIRAAIEGHLDKKQAMPQFFPVMSMDAAMKTATELAKPGDVVLLSPACASFDLFKSYTDRGDQFTNLVKRYAHRNIQD